MAKVFLVIIGTAYLILAIWCSIDPGKTSQAVGFQLEEGSGESEYLVVYGGLQFALGVVFLFPLFQPELLKQTLKICIITHGSLVMFRTAGFILYSEIQTTTWVLALTEWLTFICAILVYRTLKNSLVE